MNESKKTGQFILIDDTSSYIPDHGNSVDEPSSGFYMVFRAAEGVRPDENMHRKSKEIPDSWLSPVDYFNGSIHIRIEVLEKPNNTQRTSMLARVCTESHEGEHNIWFGYRIVMFSTLGVHYFDQDVKWAYPMAPKSKFNWEKPIFEIQLAITDTAGHPIHRTCEQSIARDNDRFDHFWLRDAIDDFEGYPDLSLYLPLKVRYTAIVVSKRGIFNPPEWW